MARDSNGNTLHSFNLVIEILMVDRCFCSVGETGYTACFNLVIEILMVDRILEEECDPLIYIGREFQSRNRDSYG